MLEKSSRLNPTYRSISRNLNITSLWYVTIPCWFWLAARLRSYIFSFRILMVVDLNVSQLLLMVEELSKCREIEKRQRILSFSGDLVDHVVSNYVQAILCQTKKFSQYYDVFEGRGEPSHLINYKPLYHLGKEKREVDTSKQVTNCIFPQGVHIW